MFEKKKNIKYSLGYNFDLKLLNKIIELNEITANKITEFYGALQDSPIPSARPTKRIPEISWSDFKKQIELMSQLNIKFNYLMNTFFKFDKKTENKLKKYLDKLYDIGVNTITVGNPEMCNLFKNIDNRFNITISSIFGAKTKDHIIEAENNGADEIYLDGLYVNRNIGLLDELINSASIKIKLYANISCLSQCPLKDNHYAIFFQKQTAKTIVQNDKYFEWCSEIKLKNPVQWLQMPWIRPEDINFYNNLGVSSFKLSDRLAPTETLLFIAYHYLIEESPDNLFRLIERDGAKYHKYFKSNKVKYPIYVYSSKIPSNFIDHFSKEGCNSNNLNCNYCNNIANKAIKIADKIIINKEYEYKITENHLY